MRSLTVLVLLALSAGSCAESGAAAPREEASESASASPSAVPSKSFAVLTDEDRHQLDLTLGPIPSGAPAPLISQQEAVQSARVATGAVGEPGQIERGVATIIADDTASAWLVVFLVDEPQRPGGLVCTDGEACTSIQTDLTGALVSDQSGEVLRMFSSGHQVEATAGP